MKRLLGVIILYISSRLYYSCPENCICDNSTVSCSIGVPAVLPTGTISVVVNATNSSVLSGQHFNHTSWQTVEDLRIRDPYSAEKGQEFLSSIVGKPFLNLQSIRTLGLNCHRLETLDNTVFHGLEKVVTLDLGNCVHLHVDFVTAALKEDNVLPHLEVLLLTEIQTYIDDLIYVNIGEEFINALETKPIKYLGLGKTNLEYFEFQNIHKRLSVLEVLNFTGAECRFLLKGNLDDIQFMSNLKAIDFSSAKPPVVVGPIFFTSLFVKIFEKLLYDVFCVPDLYINDIFKDAFIFNGTKFYFTDQVELPTRKIEAKYNHLQWLNCTFPESSLYMPKLEELSLAGNGMQYFSPNTGRIFDKVRKVDLSNNDLYHMEQYKEFGLIFQYLVKLEEVSLSSNRISVLPKVIFKTNKNISSIDLSKNKLEHVTFEMQHLLKLVFLNLRYNKISFLDGGVFEALDSIFSRQLQTGAEEHISVDISFNPLTCTCDKKSSAFRQNYKENISRFRNKEKTTCIGDEGILLLNISTIDKIHGDCEYKIFTINMIIGFICTPCFAALLIVSVILPAKKFGNHRLERKRKEQKIRRLAEIYKERKFLVFLAFSREDYGFALHTVYKQLEDKLGYKLQTDKELVCVSEIHFPSGRIKDNIIKYIEASQVVLLLISREFCKSPWCEYETQVAKSRKKPIIPMFMEKVPPAEMPLALSAICEEWTHFTWIEENGEPVLRAGWDKLCDSILDLCDPALAVGSNTEVRDQALGLEQQHGEEEIEMV